MIRRETWIVLAIFVIALAGLFIWQRNRPDSDLQAAEEAGPQEFLFDLQDGTVQSVRLERVGDRVVEFERDQTGSWQIAWPANTPGDSAALEGALAQLSTVSVLGRLDNSPTLEEMGLNPPHFRLLLTLQDGRQLTTSVGRLTPTGSGYYVLNSDRTVSIVNNYSLDPILDLLENLPLAPTETPETSPSSAAGGPGTEMPAAATESIPETTPVGTP